jgi:hypothetical protein
MILDSILMTIISLALDCADAVRFVAASFRWRVRRWRS